MHEECGIYGIYSKLEKESLFEETSQRGAGGFGSTGVT